MEQVTFWINKHASSVAIYNSSVFIQESKSIIFLSWPGLLSGIPTRGLESRNDSGFCGFGLGKELQAFNMLRTAITKHRNVLVLDMLLSWWLMLAISERVCSIHNALGFLLIVHTAPHSGYDSGSVWTHSPSKFWTFSFLCMCMAKCGITWKIWYFCLPERPPVKTDLLLSRWECSCCHHVIVI